MDGQTDGTQLERWIRQYLDYITYERNFSPYTIEGRQKLLFFFLKFAGLTPLSTNLIRDFLRYLAQERKWNARLNLETPNEIGLVYLSKE